jgi:hypothetical protein
MNEKPEKRVRFSISGFYLNWDWDGISADESSSKKTPRMDFIVKL